MIFLNAGHHPCQGVMDAIEIFHSLVFPNHTYEE